MKSMKKAYWKKFAVRACSWTLAAMLSAGNAVPVLASAPELASAEQLREVEPGVEEGSGTDTETEAGIGSGTEAGSDTGAETGPDTSEAETKPSPEEKPSGGQDAALPQGPADRNGLLYVDGKLYSGYYLGKNNKLYYVNKGEKTLYIGTLKAGQQYYSYSQKKTRKLSKQTIYVKGKAYSGYYLGKNKKLYRVKKGIKTLYTGTVKAGKQYYTYSLKKTKKLSKQTVYVKGKAYSGYYMGKNKKLYYVKKGKKTACTEELDKGTKYFDVNSAKQKSLSKQTIYLSGKAVSIRSKMELSNLRAAMEIVGRITDDSMTKKQKLKACFDYVKTYKECRPRTPNYLGDDWPVLYANDMFEKGTGNCCSYSAALAYMVRVVGYEEVYCCNSGGTDWVHGWLEIDGLVYDPEWSLHHFDRTYYGLSYEKTKYPDYKGAIKSRKSWMRVKML